MSDEDEVEYAVVINEEEQYSVWASYLPLPDGWKETGFHGSRDSCLEHIDQVWTDITPASVRRARTGRSGETPEE